MPLVAHLPSHKPRRSVTSPSLLARLQSFPPPEPHTQAVETFTQALRVSAHSWIPPRTPVENDLTAPPCETTALRQDLEALQTSLIRRKCEIIWELRQIFRLKVLVESNTTTIQNDEKRQGPLIGLHLQDLFIPPLIGMKFEEIDNVSVEVHLRSRRAGRFVKLVNRETLVCLDRGTNPSEVLNAMTMFTAFTRMVAKVIGSPLPYDVKLDGCRARVVPLTVPAAMLTPWHQLSWARDAWPQTPRLFKRLAAPYATAPPLRKTRSATQNVLGLNDGTPRGKATTTGITVPGKSLQDVVAAWQYASRPRSPTIRPPTPSLTLAQERLLPVVAYLRSRPSPSFWPLHLMWSRALNVREGISDLRHVIIPAYLRGTDEAALIALRGVSVTEEESLRLGPSLESGSLDFTKAFSTRERNRLNIATGPGAIVFLAALHIREMNRQMLQIDVVDSVLVPPAIPNPFWCIYTLYAELLPNLR